MTGKGRRREAATGNVLPPADARRYLDAPLTETEREDILALVRWFRRRYSTPVERLAYVRRAYVRWQRTRGLARPEKPRVRDSER